VQKEEEMELTTRGVIEQAKNEFYINTLSEMVAYLDDYYYNRGTYDAGSVLRELHRAVVDGTIARW